MKRKNVLILITVFFFTFVAFGILTLSNPGWLSSLFFVNEANGGESNKNYIQFPVIEGEIIRTASGDGAVVSGQADIYLEEIEITGASPANFEMLKSKGDDVYAKEPIYTLRGKSTEIDYNARILDVIYEGSGASRRCYITLLNFDKLYISVSVDLAAYAKITYDTQVSVTADGRQYAGRIKDIGYEIVDGKVPVQVTVPERLLPGLKAKVVFELETIPSGIYVPKAAVYPLGDDYYADVLTGSGNQTQQVVLSVGQTFVLNEEGVEFEYIEILSGLSANDILIVEQVDAQQGDHIKEVLDNR